MRVLMVHNFHMLGGGSDDSVRATSDALRERGHTVVQFFRDSATVAGPLSRVSASVSGVYSRNSVREFRALLKRVRPDVVHVHEVFPLISPWVLQAATQAGVPTVLTCHDYRITCPIATHYRDRTICTACLERGEVMCVRHNCRGNLAESAAYALRSFVARTASVFKDNVSVYVTPTAFARSWLLQHLVLEEDRFRVVPYPIPSAMSPHDSSSGDYIAYAGRFVVEKGISTLIAACRIADLPVRLAGDSSTMPSLANDAHVTLTGMLKGGALHKFYRSARFLVVPSTWFETFGIVAGEAMGLGLPVVASRIGALAEVVDDGITGLHFEPGNAVDLASKMSALWGDPDRCRRLGEAGWQKTTRLFSVDAHAAGLTDAYAHAIELGSVPR